MTERPHAADARCATRCRRRWSSAVLRALAKLPADRFATAAEFAAALSGQSSTVESRGVAARRAATRDFATQLSSHSARPWRRSRRARAYVRRASLGRRCLSGSHRARRSAVGDGRTGRALSGWAFRRVRRAHAVGSRGACYLRRLDQLTSRMIPGTDEPVRAGVLARRQVDCVHLGRRQNREGRRSMAARPSFLGDVADNGGIDWSSRGDIVVGPGIMEGLHGLFARESRRRSAAAVHARRQYAQRAEPRVAAHSGGRQDGSLQHLVRRRRPVGDRRRVARRRQGCAARHPRSQSARRRRWTPGVRASRRHGDGGAVRRQAPCGCRAPRRRCRIRFAFGGERRRRECVPHARRRIGVRARHDQSAAGLGGPRRQRTTGVERVARVSQRATLARREAHRALDRHRRAGPISGSSTSPRGTLTPTHDRGKQPKSDVVARRPSHSLRVDAKRTRRRSGGSRSMAAGHPSRPADAGRNPWNIDLSPDGRTVVFNSLYDGTFNLESFALDSTHEKREISRVADGDRNERTILSRRTFDRLPVGRVGTLRGLRPTISGVRRTNPDLRRWRASARSGRPMESRSTSGKAVA